MILRDQHGEIEVPFITDFEYKGATLTVVCPAAESIGGHHVIWCRLQKGMLELNGRRFQISENGHKPVLPFVDDLVAQQVRLSRLGGLQIVTPAPLQPERSAATKTSARKSKARAEQNQPTEKGLFD